MSTTKREYKLAGDPIVRPGRVSVREILQITEDGRREVFLVVSNVDAMDVLEALRRAYQDGREDNAAMLESGGRLRTEPRMVRTHDADGAIISVDARDNIARLRETHYEDATGWHPKHDVHGGPHDEPPQETGEQS